MPSELTFIDINLGSFELNQLVDSAGQDIIEPIVPGFPEATSSYTFALGSFIDGFNPTSGNIAQWADNWRTFDVALFAADPDLIGIQGGMTVDGFTVSDNPLADDTFNFSGLDAYLWIYNSTALETGTEWFLGRASTWTFPDIGLFDTNCDSCPGENPINWSTSDFASNTVSDDVPLYGNQSGVLGEGTYTALNSDEFAIQTFGVIPEPSSVILPACVLICLIFHHLRRKGAAS